MQQYAEHVSFQLPNEIVHVTFLVDAIKCKVPTLQASMALVLNDDVVTVKINNFENTESFLLLHDPVVKKRTTTRKRGNVEISDASVTNTTPLKSGIGQTSVHLRFHDFNEYKKLTQDQKDKIEEHRDAIWKETDSHHLP